MKIIQSYWSGSKEAKNGREPFSNKAGWLSPEYHWFSWALSVLQLRQFYDEVELVTDDEGKHILIDILQLPYTKVHTELNVLDSYAHQLWALAKIYTYSLQKEPFIHLDGDIYLWEKLSKNLENADLVGQNVEVDFIYYYQIMAQVKQHFKYIPDCIKKELNENEVIRSCNTGVMGGHNLTIFKEYTDLSLEFINQNKEFLPLIDMPTFNIAFEQLLYYCLAKEKYIPITYLIDREEKFDVTYKGFARFECVPYQTKFIHALGDFKRTEETCQHLARRLRQDYPEYYYKIIGVCGERGLNLYSKVYQVPDLFFPITISDKVEKYINPIDLSYYQTEKLSYKQNIKDITYWYSKDKIIYRQAQDLFSLPIAVLLEQKLVFDTEAKIIEIESDNLYQFLLSFDVLKMEIREEKLDSLNMVLLDVFLEIKTIQEGIDEIGVYFNKNEIIELHNSFQQLVLDRIKEMMYLGALKLT